MSMRFKPFPQTRLALFLVDSDTGKPLRQIPVYAEALIGVKAPSFTVSDDVTLSTQFSDFSEIRRVVKATVAEYVDVDALGGRDDERYAAFIMELYSRTKQEGLLRNDDLPADFENSIIAIVKSLARRAQVLKEVESHTIKFALGMLATDHCGFTSFDLTRLHNANLATKLSLGINTRAFATATASVSFAVYPALLESRRVDITTQARVTKHAIVGRLEYSEKELAHYSHIGLGLPSIQAPSLQDWQLSPGSFATIPQTLIGADGCENITPANFATSQFTLRQVLRIQPDTDDDGDNDALPRPLAYVNEYILSFIPLGHSLGSVLYSLPLAPGESVRLAVIDWRRKDDAARSETTKFTEALIHEQSRDRMITETVASALDEWQRGGSIMGGAAVGAGASGTIGAAGVAGGAMVSIGGAYTTSSGSRDLTANSAQGVADAVHQASVATRELQSSVVVRTDEAEKESIQTRVFFNNNRGHTMTVLYYEMLRHFRVVVKFSRKYSAALINRPDWELAEWKASDAEAGAKELALDALILKKRYLFEPALLDKSVAQGFDAIAKGDSIRKEKERKPWNSEAVKPWDDANWQMSFFTLFFKVGDARTTDQIGMRVFVASESPVADIKYDLRIGGFSDLNRDKQFSRDSSQDGFVIVTDQLSQSIAWGKIKRFEIYKQKDDGEVRPLEIKIWGRDGWTDKLVFASIPGQTFILNKEGELQNLYPNRAPFPPPTPAEPTWTDLMTPEEFVLIKRLRQHIQSERDYYARILDLSTDMNTFASRFETENWDTSIPATIPSTKLIQKVSPIPLEILGSYIAFPLLEKQSPSTSHYDSEIEEQERLVSLPTRGVFAEAKLGHCNVAEEIDETRFWRWDEHPIPMLASEIAPVVPVNPKPGDHDQALGATAFPQPIVQIQQPPSAPDPVGLAAALSAISTPNIFRDMSAKAEVSSLLSDLAKGAVDMAKASSIAKDIQNKYGETLDKQSKDENVELAKLAVEDNRIKAAQVTPQQAQQNIKLAEQQHRNGNLSKDDLGEVVKTQVGNLPGSTKPKPVSTGNTFKERTFEITVRGMSNQALPGNWEMTLRQGKTALGENNSSNQQDPNAPAAGSAGTIVHTFLVKGNDTIFKLSVTGTIASGRNAGAWIGAREMLLDVSKAPRWASTDWTYITLKAIEKSYKVMGKSIKEAVESWKNHVGAEAGVDAKIYNVKADAGREWGRDDTKTWETELEIEVLYYTGGMEISEIY